MIQAKGRNKASRADKHRHDWEKWYHETKLINFAAATAAA